MSKRNKKSRTKSAKTSGVKQLRSFDEWKREVTPSAMKESRPLFVEVLHHWLASEDSEFEKWRREQVRRVEASCSDLDQEIWERYWASEEAESEQLEASGWVTLEDVLESCASEVEAQWWKDFWAKLDESLGGSFED